MLQVVYKGEIISENAFTCNCARIYDLVSVATLSVRTAMTLPTGYRALTLTATACDYKHNV